MLSLWQSVKKAFVGTPAPHATVRTTRPRQGARRGASPVSATPQKVTLASLAKRNGKKQNALSAEEIQKKASEKQKVIQFVDALPSFKGVLTAEGGIFADIGDKYRHKFALLDLGERKCLAIVLSNAQDSHIISTTIMRAEKEGFEVVGRSIVNYKVLDDINKDAKGDDSTQFSKELSEEDQGKLLYFFSEIVNDALVERASDIHICIRKTNNRQKTGMILFRIDGDLYQKYSHKGESLMEMLSVVYNSTTYVAQNSRSHTQFQAKDPQYCTMKFSKDDHEVTLRYQDSPCKGGMDAVMRVLSDVRDDRLGDSVADLGFEPSQVRLLELAGQRPKGLMLVGGETGSGKTTTLKTMIADICQQNPHLKIYTIEDPPEFKMFKVTQISIQRSEEEKKNNKDYNPFADAAIRLMRMDPDVVMQGEIRDTHSGSAAKSLAQTGHKVLATVHVGGVFQVPERLCSNEVGIHRETLASPDFVVAVIYQELVKKLCPHCKVPGDEVLNRNTKKHLQAFGIDLSNVYCSNKDGCPECNQRGTKGRTVCAEVVLWTRDMLKLIRQGKDEEAEDIYRSLRTAPYDDQDMTGKTAFEHALYKISQGLVDPRDVVKIFGPFEIQNIRTGKDLLSIKEEEEDDSNQLFGSRQEIQPLVN